MMRNRFIIISQTHYAAVQIFNFKTAEQQMVGHKNAVNLLRAVHWIKNGYMFGEWEQRWASVNPQFKSIVDLQYHYFGFISVSPIEIEGDTNTSL